MKEDLILIEDFSIISTKVILSIYVEQIHLIILTKIIKVEVNSCF